MADISDWRWWISQIEYGGYLRLKVVNISDGIVENVRLQPMVLVEASQCCWLVIDNMQTLILWFSIVWLWFWISGIWHSPASAVWWYRGHAAAEGDHHHHRDHPHHHHRHDHHEREHAKKGWSQLSYLWDIQQVVPGRKSSPFQHRLPRTLQLLEILNKIF